MKKINMRVVLSAAGGFAAVTALMVSGPVAATASTTASGSVASATSRAGTFGDPAVDWLVETRGWDRGQAERAIAVQTRFNQRIATAAGQLNDIYAGAYFDATTLAPVVLTTSSQSDAQPRVVTALSAGDDEAGRDLVANLTVRQARYTEAQLNRARADYEALISKVNTGATSPITTGVSPETNSISLFFDANATPTRQQAGLLASAAKDARLTGRDDTAHVVATACGQAANGRLACNAPLRGGQQIFNSTGGACTSGVNVQPNNTANPNYYLISAGHCSKNTLNSSVAAPQFVGSNATGPTYTVGPVQGTNVGSGGDYELIAYSSNYWSPGPYVLDQRVGQAQRETYPISGPGANTVRTVVCKTGAVYAQTSCGQITDIRNVEIDYTDEGLGKRTINNAAVADFCTDRGDSGGPVYGNGLGYGIVIGVSGRCESYYNGLNAILTAYNVHTL